MRKSEKLQGFAPDARAPIMPAMPMIRHAKLIMIALLALFPGFCITLPGLMIFLNQDNPELAS